MAWKQCTVVPLQFCALTLCCTLPAARAALHDAGPKSTVTGELNEQDYWWAKFDAMMLEVALKQHQPDGRLGVKLAAASKRLDELTRKYPGHPEIQKWKTRVAEVQAKLDPKADAGTFGPECPWDDSAFAELWVDLHRARAALHAHDYDTAASCMKDVRQKYEVLLQPGRMKDYPDNLRKWISASRLEANGLTQAIRQKKSR
jgi:hypothetical protein